MSYVDILLRRKEEFASQSFNPNIRAGCTISGLAHDVAAGEVGTLTSPAPLRQ